MKNIATALVLSSCFLTACTEEKEIPPVTGNQNIVDQNWQFETTPFGQTILMATAHRILQNGLRNRRYWMGNNELQYYTDGGNATVNGGNLVITAKRGISIRQGIHICQDDHKRKKATGSMDVLRSGLNCRGRGTWPAIWMLSSDNLYGNWPASGEMDIMEHVGFDPNNVHCSIHTSAIITHAEHKNKFYTRQWSHRRLPYLPDRLDALCGQRFC